MAEMGLSELARELLQMEKWLKPIARIREVVDAAVQAEGQLNTLRQAVKTAESQLASLNQAVIDAGDKFEARQAEVDAQLKALDDKLGERSKEVAHATERLQQEHNLKIANLQRIWDDMQRDFDEAKRAMEGERNELSSRLNAASEEYAAFLRKHGAREDR